jgi:hypothetical protein
MKPVDVYLMYCAMKAHFGSGDYDYIKYNGKTKVSRDSFYKRKDRAFFVRLSNKHADPKDYFLANFIKDRKGYIKNFSDENYWTWKLHRKGFFEQFEIEMVPLVHNFEPLFSITSGHPKLMGEFLGGRVSIETMIILDDLVNYSKKWDEKLSDDVIWPDLKKFMKDYKRFLTIDKKGYRIRLLNLIEGAPSGHQD